MAIVNTEKGLRIASVEVFNLNTLGIFCGECIPKGCLGIKLIDKPKHEKYTRTGNILWSVCDGIVSCYEYVPGSIEGFAGRTIVLPVVEKSALFNREAVRRTPFKGSLWDSANATSVVSEIVGQKIYQVGVREHNSRYDVYCAYMATQDFIDRIAKVVVLGSPQQSPLI